MTGTDIKWVDTVLGVAPPGARTGDLATTTGPAMGASVVIAKGCLSPGDGGGGVFYWSATNGTDDGGTVIVPGGNRGTVGACWRRVFDSRAISILWFGAKADGTGVDDNAIQHAVDTIVALGGGAVRIPRGIFNVSSSSNGIVVGGDNVTIQGVGRGSIVTLGTTPKSCFAVNGAYRHIIFRDFVIQQNPSDVIGAAISFTSNGIIFCALENLYLLNVWNGILVDAIGSSSRINNISIRNVTIDSVRGTGIYLRRAIDPIISDTNVFCASRTQGTAIFIDACTEGLTTSNVVTTNGVYGIRIESTEPNFDATAPRQLLFSRTFADGSGTAAWQITNGRRIHLDECWAATTYNAQTGALGGVGVNITSPARNIEFSNCIIINCGYEGYKIHTGVKDVGISGGAIIACSTNSPGAYAALITGGAGCDGLRMVGVKVAHDGDFPRGSHAYAVTLNDSTANVIIQACDLRGYAIAPYNVGAVGTSRIKGNYPAGNWGPVSDP
jgi:hypothetical protein